MVPVFLQNYQTVAASQANVALGTPADQGAGDYLACVTVIPATLDAGAVTIKDGAGSDITIFAGGTGSVTSLVPFPIFVNARSKTGGWKITTGANLSVIVSGNFR